MSMKKYLYAVAALFLALSCTPSAEEFNPVKDAINAKLATMVKGDIDKIMYESLTLVDSTTYAQELAYRRGLMQERIDRNEAIRQQYKSAGKLTAAASRRKAINKDRKILSGLDRIGERIAEISDSTAYYTYRFSVAITSGGSVLACKDYYATITPEYDILNLTGDKSKCRFGAGSVLPGYDKVVKESDEEDALSDE